MRKGGAGMPKTGREWKTWFMESFRMMKKDLWNVRVVILVLAGYFLFVRLFLYSSCPMVMVTGFPCPGCGLSRAGFSVLRGEFSAAWHLHPFIYAIIVLAAAAAVRRYLFHKETACLKKWLILLLAGMLVFYIYRMARYFPGEPPISYYRGNLLRLLFTLAGR